MEKEILWDKDIKQCLIFFSEKQMDDFLCVVNFIQDSCIRNYIYSNTLEDERLWNWLYSKDNVELIDMKRELSRKIEKGKVIDTDEYDEKKDKVGKMGSIKTLVLNYDENNIYCISSINEYFLGIRAYLAMEKKG